MPLLLVASLLAGLLCIAPTEARIGTMGHKGRVQAIVDEHIIPPPTFSYNHEGTMCVLNNGQLLNTWQSSHEEGSQFGFAMMSRFDGDKWLEYPRKADARDNNFTPVPYQPKNVANAPLLLFLHINGEPVNWKTHIKTSRDNGWTWTDPVQAPTSSNSWLDKQSGRLNACDYTLPTELPDGTLLCPTTAGQQSRDMSPYITVIPPGYYSGSQLGGANWDIITPNWAGWRYAHGGPILPFNNYTRFRFLAWKNVQSHGGCWADKNGQQWSWGSWSDRPANVGGHIHAIPLDIEGGPLKGWYVALGDGSGRGSFDVSISNDGDNWQTILNLGDKSGKPGHSELAGQGIVQTPDRKVHVTSAGRGGFYVWHVVLDPDILINNSPRNNSGFIGFCGGAREAAEASDAAEGVSFSVVRNGGSKGSASVKYSTIDGEAKAGSDFESVSGTLTWSDGDDSPKSVYIPIIDDSDVEGYEQFHVALYDASGADLGSVDTMEINLSDCNVVTHGKGCDSPDAGVATLTHQEFFSYEDAIDDTVWVIIDRPQWDNKKGVITVSYETSDGSAKAGEDYRATSGSVTWKMVTADRAQSGPKNIGIPLIDDSNTEGNESFNFSITNVTGGAIIGTRNTAAVTIVDNEAGGATIGSVSSRAHNAAHRAIHTRLIGEKLVVTSLEPMQGQFSISLIDARGKTIARSIRNVSTLAQLNHAFSLEQFPAGILYARVKATANGFDAISKVIRK
ncbi:MAG: hypothetical protein GF398_08165 [Chitinivibrionales bacterium]|nr:hypothetical protein [Chitinivibrionales bacterium]